MQKQSGPLLNQLLVGGGVTAGVGGLAALAQALLAKKVAIQSPDTQLSMPIARKAEKQASSVAQIAAAVTPAHVLGGAVGLPAGYKLVTHLLEMKRGNQLDQAIKEHQDKLTAALLEEQNLSMGKQANILTTPISTLIDNAPAAAGLVNEIKGSSDLNKLMLALLGTSGAGYMGVKAYDRANASDFNRALKAKVESSLADRLQTGKKDDNMRAPMVIKLQAGDPAMSPMRPGASSLVDASRGRDVLTSF